MSVFRVAAISALVLVAVPVGCTYLGVFNNAATAPARVVNKTLETDNIIFNYERFFDINANYQARVAQVAQYKGFYESEKDPAEKTRLRTEMAAMQQSCRDLANEYNADSQKMNRNLFKSKNLSYELSTGLCE